MRRFWEELKGQNLLEYTSVILLVVAGITIMGPYVVRSWNAYLKGEEDAVQDSFHDPLLFTDPDNIIPDCSCEFLPPCDAAPCCAVSPCGVTEEKLVKVCDPIGCEEDEHQCLPNDNCCSDPEPGECGVSADPPCPDGQRRFHWECGDGPHSECQDDPLCDFECIGLPPNYQGELCTGAGEHLPEDTLVTTVDDCSDGSAPCKFLCGGGNNWIADPSQTFCECPDCFSPQGQACVATVELLTKTKTASCDGTTDVSCPGGWERLGGGINVPTGAVCCDSCGPGGDDENLSWVINRPKSNDSWQCGADNFKATCYVECYRCD